MPLLNKFNEAKSLVKSAVPGNTFEPTEFDDKYAVSIFGKQFIILNSVVVRD